MFPSIGFIRKEYRFQVYERVDYLVQYPSNFFTKTTFAKISREKRVWKTLVLL